MAHGEHREEIHVDHPHAYDTHEPRSSMIVIYGIATVVFLLVTAAAIQFYYERMRERRVYTEVLAPEGEQLKALRYKEDWELSNYQRLDPAKGVMRIPIDRAMQLVAEDAAANRPKYPTAATPVKTPEQLAGQVPPVSQPGAAAAEQTSQPGAGSQGARTPMH